MAFFPKNDTFLNYLKEEDARRLMDLEGRFGELLRMLQGDVTLEEVASLILSLQEYAAILKPYDRIPPLAKGVSELADAMALGDGWETPKEEVYVRLLFGIIFNLIRWRHDVFELGIKNPHVYDDSLLNDLAVISCYFRGELIGEDSEVTFFDPTLPSAEISIEAPDFSALPVSSLPAKSEQRASA